MCEYVLPDSEVEVLVINHADVMMMQNWAHVQTVLNACNGLPKDAHGGNIMRVHKAHLNNWVRHLRQMVVLSGRASINPRPLEHSSVKYYIQSQF